jgi:tetrahydromethanopterin S-methyltransferase subunit G
MEKMMLERLNTLGDQISGIGAEVAKVSTRAEDMAKTLDEIKTQTMLTNGRVTSLEGFRIKIVAYATVIGIIVSSAFHFIGG